MTKQLIDGLNKQYPGKYSKIYANSAEYFNGNYRAFDCSGLCCWCYKNVLGKDISEGYGWRPNSSKAVKVMGSNTKVTQLQIGDVIESPGHYVMYRGDGKAVESCGSQGLADDRPWTQRLQRCLSILAIIHCLTALGRRCSNRAIKYRPVFLCVISHTPPTRSKRRPSRCDWHGKSRLPTHPMHRRATYFARRVIS